MKSNIKQNIFTLFFKSVFLFITILLFGRCANIVAPSGGEGNKTLPIVESASIDNGHTNFHSNEITLEFNQYMNRNAVTDNIIIAPKIKYSYQWNAKKISIIFVDTLKNNTTYSLQLGGAFADYYGNVAKEPYYIYFSTGELIDTGKISGKVIANKTDGYYVFCYIIPDVDTADKFIINYLTQTPDYKVQIGTNGNFTIPALKDGNYRLIAVKDVDKDGLVTQIKDTVGTSTFDPVVKNGNSDFVQIIPNKVIDIVPPEIIDVASVHQKELAVKFSEKIVLEEFNTNSIYLTNNTDSAHTFPINFTVDNPDDTKEIRLCFKDTLKNNTLYSLNIDSNNFTMIKDANKNPFYLAQPYKFTMNTDSLLVELQMKSFSIPDSAKNVKTDEPFKIIFYSPIVYSPDISNNIKLYKDTAEVELVFSHPFSNQIICSTKHKLDEKTKYKFIINPIGIKDIWDNKILDTATKTINFETGKSKIYSQFSGMIVDSNKCESTRYLRIKQKNVQEKPAEYTTKINADNTFLFPKVLPGEYVVMYFCDLNENGKYDFGSLNPLVFAEPFSLIEQSVIIKERWNVDNYLLEIK